MGADNSPLEIGCEELKGIAVLACEGIGETWGIELSRDIEENCDTTDARHVVCEDFVDHRWAQIGWPDTEVGTKPLITDDLGILVKRRNRSNAGENILEPSQLFSIQDGNHGGSEFAVVVMSDLGVVVMMRHLQNILALGKHTLGDARANIPTWAIKIWRC